MGACSLDPRKRHRMNDKTSTIYDDKPKTEKVKSSHLYLYSAFNNTDCVKAALQYRKIVFDNAKGQ